MNSRAKPSSVAASRARRRPPQPLPCVGTVANVCSETHTALVVECPLPPVELSPNGRYHWAVKARAAKAYRAACGWCFRAVLTRGWMEGDAPVVIDVEYRCHRGCGGHAPRDLDNALASIKQIPDAMVDAGIIPNDSKKWLSWGSFDLVTTRQDKPAGVTVTVRAR